MRVKFAGHDFDIRDTEALSLAARQHAEQMALTQIATGADPREVLTTLLAGVVRYHIASGAVLAGSKAIGAIGISLQQALDQHNFIGELIAQAPLDLGLADDERGAVAVPERRLVDQEGRPIPDGQQDLPLS